MKRSQFISMSYLGRGTRGIWNREFQSFHGKMSLSHSNLAAPPAYSKTGSFSNSMFSGWNEGSSMKFMIGYQLLARTQGNTILPLRLKDFADS